MRNQKYLEACPIWTYEQIFTSNLQYLFKEHYFYSESFKVQHVNLSSPSPHSSHSEGLLLILPLAHIPFS